MFWHDMGCFVEDAIFLLFGDGKLIYRPSMSCVAFGVPFFRWSCPCADGVLVKSLTLSVVSVFDRLVAWLPQPGTA